VRHPGLAPGVHAALLVHGDGAVAVAARSTTRVGSSRCTLFFSWFQSWISVSRDTSKNSRLAMRLRFLRACEIFFDPAGHSPAMFLTRSTHARLATFLLLAAAAGNATGVAATARKKNWPSRSWPRAASWTPIAKIRSCARSSTVTRSATRTGTAGTSGAAVCAVQMERWRVPAFCGPHLRHG